MFGKFLYRLSSTLFVLALATMGVLFFLVPKQKMSELEKRDLCKMPTFSWEKLKSGKFVDSLDLYYADNFPFREQFVALGFQLDQWQGIPSKEVAFYNKSIDMDAGTEEIKNAEDSSGTKTDSIDTEDKGGDTKGKFHNEGFASDVKSLSRGLLIYNGMAIQMFGGGRSTAKYMAQSVNDIRRLLGDEVNIHVGVTPTHGEFYLPSEYIESSVSEKKNIDTIYKYLDPSIKTFDVTAELFKHKKEYIFFNTDHHWTGTGAYYAYVAFCKSAGITPVPLEKMDRGVIPNFLGTLYRSTRDKRLEENKDSVVYHKVPISYKAYQLYGNGYGLIRNSNLYVELASGGNAYGVFLGGDLPALCVVSKQKNGKRVLILKNSFGNAISPYFVSHFERTYIGDYRYFKCGLKDFIEKNQITDLVIFHNSFSANTPSHVDMIKQIAKDSTVCVPHPLPDWEVMFPEGVLMEKVLAAHKKALENPEAPINKEQPNIQKKPIPNKNTTPNKVINKNQPINKDKPSDSPKEQPKDLPKKPDSLGNGG